MPLRLNVASQRKSWDACLLVALLTGTLSGCTSFLADDSSLIPWFEGDTVLPTRMNTIWSDTILQERGKPGVRGVGGRLMFYTSQQKEPITVEGTLTVYVYDHAEEKRVEPARKYVFTADQLPKHYSKSDLGHSYSFWLPWGGMGGPPKQLTLIARFEPVEGGAVLSDPAQQHLPGIPPKSLEDPATSDSRPSDRSPARKDAIRPVQHIAALPSDQRKPSPREVITIDIPPSLLQGHVALPAEAGQPSIGSFQEGPVSQGISPRRKTLGRVAIPSSRESTVARDEVESSADLPPATGSVQNGDTLRPVVDPRRTRRRLQAWLSERRPSRKVAPRGESGVNR